MDSIMKENINNEVLATLRELNNIIDGPYDDPVISEELYNRIQNILDRVVELENSSSNEMIGFWQLVKVTDYNSNKKDLEEGLCIGDAIEKLETYCFTNFNVWLNQLITEKDYTVYYKIKKLENIS